MVTWKTGFVPEVLWQAEKGETMNKTDLNILKVLLRDLCSDQDHVTHYNESHGTMAQIREAQAQREYTKRRIVAFVESKVQRAEVDAPDLVNLSPEVQALVKALRNSQKRLKTWSAYLDAEDRCGDWGQVIEAIKANTVALTPFEDAPDAT